jgi:hypothetical protein
MRIKVSSAHGIVTEIFATTEERLEQGHLQDGPLTEFSGPAQ